QEVFQGHIRRVVPVRTNQSIGSVGLYVSEQRLQGNAFPRCGQLRPPRNTVQIDCNSLAGQVAKRFPIPPLQNILAVIDHKLPSVEWDVHSGARRQDREISDEILTWRQLDIRRSASTRKASRDDPHVIPLTQRRGLSEATFHIAL